MENKITVVLADGCQNGFANFKEFLQSKNDISVVGRSYSGRECLRLIQEKQPDVLVMEYRMAGLDAIGVLDRLPAGVLPKVLVVADASSESLALHCLTRGAIDVVLKPFDSQRLYEIIKETYFQSDLVADSRPGRYTTVKKKMAKASEAEQRVVELLIDFGMDSHVKGFTFTKDAIIYVMGQGERLADVYGKEIYGAVAEKNKAPITSVERTIRSALKKLFDVGDKEYLMDFFSIPAKDYKALSNLKFIHAVTQRLVSRRV